MTKKRRDLLRGLLRSASIGADREKFNYIDYIARRDALQRDLSRLLTEIIGRPNRELDPRVRELLDRDIDAIARSAPSRTPEELFERLEARRAAPSPARMPTRRARSERVWWVGVALACVVFATIVGVTGDVGQLVELAAPAIGILGIEVERLVRSAADRCGVSLKSEARSKALAIKSEALLTIETPPDIRAD